MSTRGQDRTFALEHGEMGMKLAGRVIYPGCLWYLLFLAAIFVSQDSSSSGKGGSSPGSDESPRCRVVEPRGETILIPRRSRYRLALGMGEVGIAIIKPGQGSRLRTIRTRA